MERLTGRFEHPVFPGAVTVRGKRLGEAYFENTTDYQDYADALDKLAAYEDAEEQGRLIVLPCKVGDTFFAVAYSSEPRVITARVYQLSFDGEETTIWVENVEDTKDWWKLSLEMFLKWCHFSTSEEAEKALEGIKCLK